MMRALLGAFMLMMFAGSVGAQDSPSRPKGPPPAQVPVRIDKGQLVVPHVVQDARQETRTRTVNKDGQDRQEQYTATVPVLREELQRLNLSDVQAFDTTGKKIDPAQLPDLLSKETVVLVSTDGRPVDPFYLQIIKEGTLVLILPVPKPPANERVAPPPRRPSQSAPADR
jgi:hypothetical protein